MRLMKNFITHVCDNALHIAIKRVKRYNSGGEREFGDTFRGFSAKTQGVCKA